MGRFIPPAGFGYASHTDAETRNERLHRIGIRKRYIDAKLRKFELDQVTKPFRQTVADQGWDRALTGFIQRWSLKAVGQYDDYIGKQKALIDSDRSIVEVYEEANGRETATRTLYHEIRDNSATKTYRDTRRAFRKIRHELSQQGFSELESRVQRGAYGLLEWMRYNRHGLTAAAAGIVAFLAVGIPSHSYWENKDHNRPVSYKKYKDDLYGAVNAGDENFRLHPMTRMAISAHNLEMYLHDTWNRSYRFSNAAVEAQEWDDFIRPGANPSVLKKLHNWAGNDSTRPYAHIFLDAKELAEKHMAPAVKPVQAIAHGAAEAGSAWTYRTWDDTHEDCTEDSEGNKSCTTVCDRTHHVWDLDKTRYLNGVSNIHNGRRQFPELERARTVGLLETPNTLGLLLTGNNIDEVHEKVAHYNKWTDSIMIKGYNQLLMDAGSLKASAMPDFFFDNEQRLEQGTFHNINPFCGGPTEYPFGWHENERLRGQAGAVVNGFSRISDSFSKFDTVVPRIERDMDTLRQVESYGGKTKTALRDLGNLAYELGNANMKGSEWHPTYGQRIALELLAYLAVGAMAGGAAYGIGKRTADYGWRRRMGRAGLY